VGSDHSAWDDDEYISGDRTQVFVSTAQGRFIRVEHDVNSPHPYSRETMLKGTLGSLELDNSRIYSEPLGHTNHSWRTGNTFNNIMAQFDHWIWPTLQQLAGQYGGHGGGDFISIWRTVQLMRLGMTPDIDVYDSAAWCSVIPLSDESLKTGSLKPVKVPDFTRGHWQEARPTFDRERPEDPWLDAVVEGLVTTSTTSAGSEGDVREMAM